MKEQENALSELVIAVESLNCSSVAVFMWGPGVCSGGVYMRCALRTYRNTHPGSAPWSLSRDFFALFSCDVSSDSGCKTKCPC